MNENPDALHVSLSEEARRLAARAAGSDLPLAASLNDLAVRIARVERTVRDLEAERKAEAKSADVLPFRAGPPTPRAASTPWLTSGHPGIKPDGDGPRAA